MNLIPGRLTSSGGEVNGHSIRLPVTAADRSGQDGPVTLGVRPEAFTVAEGNDGIPVKVTLVEELGADAFVYGKADDGTGAGIDAGTDITVRVAARRHFERGQTIMVTADPKDIHVFDTESGERVGKREDVRV